MKPRVLFIIKKRASYGISYGLANSCQFLVNGLSKKGIEAKIVEVIDNNGIDKEVHLYKPTHAIIEALWVVPEKFHVLLQLHKNVKWFVRLHSNTPFLATEGIAFQWLRAYDEIQNHFDNFKIAVNSTKLQGELASSLNIQTEYLPNIYNPTKKFHNNQYNDKYIHIGCFGAIRPFKNHVEQALAAISFGDSVCNKIKFHINSSRFEGHGEPFLKNLRAIFSNSEHELVEHDWMNHEEFVQLVRKMNIGMQVSFTETYNIIAADFVSNNIPIVGSKEIEWLCPFYQAHPTDFRDIVGKLRFAWYASVLDVHILNKLKLEKFNKESLNQWLRFLKY